MDIHCLVAGDEPKQGGVAEESADYTDQVRRRARSGPLQGRVTRLGHRDDIRPVLAASDVLAVPAFAEPFGIVVLEAFALGIPVVASATAGPRETISHGETGLLVPPGDAQQLARALKRVHDETDACEAMTERARLYVEGNFSEERLRTRLYDVYASVLGIDTSQVSSEPMAAVGQ
jgi:glycosyltransferase involved in cell wall biosynthesis